jgi:hypothetical protein
VALITLVYVAGGFWRDSTGGEEGEPCGGSGRRRTRGLGTRSYERSLFGTFRL